MIIAFVVVLAAVILALSLGYFTSPAEPATQPLDTYVETKPAEATVAEAPLELTQVAPKPKRVRKPKVVATATPAVATKPAAKRVRKAKAAN